MSDLMLYIILGVVQGVTEFLPISSDGHLAILSNWLDMPGDDLGLAVVLHLGSLGAIIWVFRREILALFTRRGRDIPNALGGVGAPVNSRTTAGSAGTPEDPREKREEQRRARKPSLLSLIILATVPVVVAGPLLYPLFVDSFASMVLAGAMLIVTGIILFCSRIFRDRNETLDARTALVMGIAQAFALLPGLSRSALTMTAGFALGVERQQVARFSFLMAVPAIAGANILELANIRHLQVMSALGLSAGVIAAFVTSLLAIRLLLGLVRRGRFEWFGAYCIVVGIAVLILGRHE